MTIYRIVPVQRSAEWYQIFFMIMERFYPALRAPKKWTKKRARFWFTEFGWKYIGRHIAADLPAGTWRLRRKGNPKASDVVWGDCYQLALLPT